MKKLLLTLFLVMCSVLIYAQEPVLTYMGDLYFIPGSMTKAGEAFMISVDYNESNKYFTIYNGDFKVVKEFNDPSAGTFYQERVVTMARDFDLGAGPATRAYADWSVVDDQTYDYTTNPNVDGIEIYSDDNTYHSRSLYVSQTLFDDDEEFEYVRRRQTIVPISIKYSDYVKEHSTISDYNVDNPTTGNEKLDSIMKETGADSYDVIWDEQSGKYLYRLYKHEQYGGLFTEGLEIATLDGNVKIFIPGVSYFSSAYYFRGKCYFRGYGNNENILYLLENSSSNIKEIKREKVPFVVSKVGNNLIVENNGNNEQTIVLTNIGGQVLRNVKANKDRTLIPLQGLMSGVYNITLFERSIPMVTSKLVIK